MFVIRTRRVPFFRSRPSKPLLVSVIAVVAIGSDHSAELVEPCARLRHASACVLRSARGLCGCLPCCRRDREVLLLQDPAHHHERLAPTGSSPPYPSHRRPLEPPPTPASYESVALVATHSGRSPSSGRSPPQVVVLRSEPSWCSSAGGRPFEGAAALPRVVERQAVRPTVRPGDVLPVTRSVLTATRCSWPPSSHVGSSWVRAASSSGPSSSSFAMPRTRTLQPSPVVSSTSSISTATIAPVAGRVQLGARGGPEDDGVADHRDEHREDRRERIDADADSSDSRGSEEIQTLDTGELMEGMDRGHPSRLARNGQAGRAEGPCVRSA